MDWAAARAWPVPAATTESAVFLIANGLSNFTVGLTVVSVLTVTPSSPVAAPAGNATTAAAPSPAVRTAEMTRKRAAARVRTRLLSMGAGERGGYRSPRATGPRRPSSASGASQPLDHRPIRTGRSP